MRRREVIPPRVFLGEGIEEVSDGGGRRALQQDLCYDHLVVASLLGPPGK
tara:strand:+ start:2182 stop:2331 length:150 start_codon:yes stop_codon:yes gene_type:complete